MQQPPLAAAGGAYLGAETKQGASKIATACLPTIHLKCATPPLLLFLCLSTNISSCQTNFIVGSKVASLRKEITMSQKFIVGAYASMPDTNKQDEYYRLLGQLDWVNGIEIPYPGDLADNATWLAERLCPQWDSNTITAIPGTMQNVGKNPLFGLACADEEGRGLAIAQAKQISEVARELSDYLGHAAVSKVQVHSAPTRLADASAFRTSLEELKELDWGGATIVVEHCDRFIKEQPPEKGFLSLTEEIEICRTLGLKIHINWGRSAVEGRSAATPYEHILEAGQSGVLAGVFFSGAGSQECAYGYAWIDGHLPAQPDEPSSLMSEEEISRCSKAAIRGGAKYLGAKICVPKDAPLEQRIRMLKTIYNATR